MASSDTGSRGKPASSARPAPPSGTPSPRLGELPRAHPNYGVLPLLGYNEFSAPSSEDPLPNPSLATEGSVLWPRNPILFINPPEGPSREIVDDDYETSVMADAESDDSDNFVEVEFTSIRSIDKGGLGTWEPYPSRYPHEKGLEGLPSMVAQGDGDNSLPQKAIAAVDNTSADPTAVIGVGNGLSYAKATTTGSVEFNTALDAALDADVQLQEVLDTSLRDACQTSKFSMTEFLPLDELCYILSRPKICELLAQTFPDWDELQLEARTDDICGPTVPSTGRRKLLAILVLIDKIYAIESFIKGEVLDIDLPLEVVPVGRRRYSLSKKGDDDPRSPLRSIKWSRNIIQAFRVTQPVMMASYFNIPPNVLYYYKLSREFTLPFTYYKKAHEGDFGRVWKVRIHRSHHNYRHHEHPDDNPFFALKAIDSPNPDVFKKEVEALQRFSGANKPNPHLIRLLLAFHYCDTYYLLFPWADGNLREFWARHPTSTIDWRRSCWLIKQCHGITRGLYKIHHAKSDSFLEKGGREDKDWGRHGDIKPENILYFDEDDQRLVISDFGLSCYHSHQSISKDSYESLEGFSPTYRPPECDTRDTISPRWDIWGLGCVFLEFLSWFILGNSFTDRLFTSERIRDEGGPGMARILEDKFFKIITGEGNIRRYAVIKPSVIKWIRRLHSSEKCPEFVHDFLDLIEEHLLLVDSNARWDCAMIATELDRIRLRCEESEEYSVRGVPSHQSQTLDRIGTTGEANDPSEDDDNNLEFVDFNEPGPEFPITIMEFAPSDGSAYHSGWTGDVTSDTLESSGTYLTSIQTLSIAESRLSSISEMPESQDTEKDLAHNKVLPSPGLYTAETAYSPSETNSLPPLRSRTYIDNLASRLMSAVASCEPDQETMKRVSADLPDLLRAFSLKIGFRADPKQCHIAYFLHKYRRLLLEPPSSKPDASSDPPDMREYNMNLFLANLALAGVPAQEDYSSEGIPSPAAEPTSPAASEYNDELDHVEHPEPDPYQEYVLNSPAFDWLVATLLTEIKLTCQTADVMRDIRTQILRTLPSTHDVSRRNASREYRANFAIDWDPLSFVKEQQYDESPDQAIKHSITLTGSPADAQALTTAQYLAQTWPTSGADVMELVTEVIHNTGHHSSKTLLDGTEVEAWIENSKFLVQVVGIGDSVAEVAQQFAWMGAALRSSPYESGIAMCSPVVRNTRLEPGNAKGKAAKPEAYAAISCTIEFDIQPPLDPAQRTAGNCWHSMLRNPVMVRGYPILAKHSAGLGLEMQLNVMARLAGSNHASEFDGKVFLKGFSAMLVATQIARDIILWHYFFNAKGERLSYFDHDLECIKPISLQQFGKARHVVGWCVECDSYAGAEDIEYQRIRSVDLPGPHAGCVLEKVSLSGGMLVTGGVSFAVGTQHIPPHLTRDSYMGKLEWIATRYTVFWDEKERRGWLVNGTSALLHLVRATIHHRSSGDFKKLMVIKPGDIKSPAEREPNTASKVLSDPDNLEVKVQIDKIKMTSEKRPGGGAQDPATTDYKPKLEKTYKMFGDIVEEKYRHLEQILDYQVHAGGQNGIKIKPRVRKHLEGWDFMELVEGHDPSPRVATLQAMGWSWVDFARSIEAVTFIGAGFGEMIRPRGYDGMCNQWATLRAQKYYLGATVFDLQKIIGTKKFGGRLLPRVSPVRGLIWHCPDRVTASCHCCSTPEATATALKPHHNPVQVFYPTASQLIPSVITGPGDLYTRGAVVFGHNISWGFRWRNKGDEYIEEDNLDMTEAVADETGPAAAAAASAGSDQASDQASAGRVASPGFLGQDSSYTATRQTSVMTVATASTPAESEVESLTVPLSAGNVATSTSARAGPPESPDSGGTKKRKREKRIGWLRSLKDRMQIPRKPTP